MVGSIEHKGINISISKNYNNNFLGDIKNSALGHRNDKKDKTVLITMISGLFSGSIAKLITHPIDTIKARIQVETKTHEKMFHSINNLVQKEGIKGLYRGIGISVFGSLPGCVLYYGSYEFAKKHLLFLNYFEKSEFLMYFISGIFAETLSCLVFVPVDIVKERRQVQSKLKTYEYKNDLDALFQIIKTEKIKGIYRAYGATIMSFGPMSAFYFMFYEYFKGFFVQNDAKSYIKKLKKENLNYDIEKSNILFLESLLCSGLASCLASYITTPLDLVKFRMQVQRASIQYNANTAEYKNMLQGLIRIGYDEGIRGLFRGSLARVLAYAPTGALSMTFLELFKPRIAKFFD